MLMRISGKRWLFGGGFDSGGFFSLGFGVGSLLQFFLGVLVLGILAHGFAFEAGFGHGCDEKLNGADGVVVAGDDVVDDVGIAVGVGDGHDRDAELAAF